MIDIGPGAGRFGGEITAQGSTAEVARADTFTGKWLRGEGKTFNNEPRTMFSGWLKLHKPSGYNLKIETLKIPLVFWLACAEFPALGRAH